MAALAASGVVADITHILVNSKRFTSDGGLISCNDGCTDVLLLFIIRIGVVLGVVSFWVVDHFLVFLEHVGLVVVANQAGFTCNNLAFFHNELLSLVSTCFELEAASSLQYHQVRVHEL